MKRILMKMVLAGVVLVLLTGCGGSGAKKATPQPSEVKSTPSTSSARQPTSQPDVQSTSQPAVQSTSPSEEEAAFDLEDRQAGLSQLQSYQARWQTEWKSSAGDQATDVALEWFQEYTSESQAVHMRMMSVDRTAGEKTTTMETWRIGKDAYLLSGEGAEKPTCISFSSEDQDPVDQSVFDIGSLGRVEDAKYVGAETVNGVRTKHYRYRCNGLSRGRFPRV